MKEGPIETTERFLKQSAWFPEEKAGKDKFPVT
jgi:hypothetical protein